MRRRRRTGQRPRQARERYSCIGGGRRLAVMVARNQLTRPKPCTRPDIKVEQADRIMQLLLSPSHNHTTQVGLHNSQDMHVRW